MCKNVRNKREYSTAAGENGRRIRKPNAMT